MREILFRGKRKDNGEWVEGLLSQSTVIAENKSAYVATAIDKIVKKPFDGGWYEIDSETVGQFTGLLDNNGERIFEGDIVVYDNTPYNAFGHRVTGEIVWHKCAWRLKYKEYGATYYYALGSEDFFGVKSEVIGNIHDNPELLEDRQ